VHNHTACHNIASNLRLLVRSTGTFLARLALSTFLLISLHLRPDLQDLLHHLFRLILAVLQRFVFPYCWLSVGKIVLSPGSPLPGVFDVLGTYFTLTLTALAHYLRTSTLVTKPHRRSKMDDVKI
jgi:hypothetical protein